MEPWIIESVRPPPEAYFYSPPNTTSKDPSKKVEDSRRSIFDHVQFTLEEEAAL
jgi:hypothetical protein